MGFLRTKLGQIRRQIFGNADDEVRELKRRVESLDILLKSYLDIRAMPRARGGLRLIQLADTALLKLLAEAMTRNGLEYWLESGTLLGAVRHKGFIPWDDDIDISVTRAGYSKLEKVIEKELPESEGFRAVRSDCIRLQFMGTPCQIDIFPYDVYNVPVDDVESAEERIWSERKALHKKLKVNWDRLKTDGHVLSGMSLEEIDSKSANLVEINSGERRLVLVGFEVFGDTDFFIPYEAVFPLAEMEFEGLKFKVPCDSDKILVRQFGDYMQFPREIPVHDDIRSRFTDSSVAKMKALIKKAGLAADFTAAM